MKYVIDFGCKSLLAAAAVLLAASVHADERIIPQGANVAPNGDRLEVTSKCLRLNGRALIPVMGEMHYSRVPRGEWAKSLATMKEGGVSIVSTYVFWNHHEWKEGEWDFSGNRDLTAFLGEVKKAGLWAVVRIGPWAHGECREGGFPDWLVDKAFEWANGDAKKARQILRSRDARFLGETKKLFERVHSEVAPYLWKNGGPVVGVQLENESRGPWPYYQALKALAVEIGYDVPLYTRTGWPQISGGETTFGEMIPLYGDYAEGFWDRELKSMPGDYKRAFEMRPARTSSVIATDILGGQKAEDAKGADSYPYFTCELGGGMASSYHRRLNMEPMDAFALAVVKLGSGSNLPGFYMYHGGSNPTDTGVNMAESQRGLFTNHNDLPRISYEFQSPLSEFGEPQYAYWMIKALAKFCREYGEELATEDPVFISKHEARRGRFVFHNDYVRRMNPNGECWIGVEKDGKVERLLDGRALAGRRPSPVECRRFSTTDLKLLKPAGTPPPVVTGPGGVATMPDEKAWDAAAEYEVPFAGGDEMLEISYEGDMARLYADGRFVQDDFWKGVPVRYALRRLPKGTKRLVLKVLPRGAGWEDKVYVDIIPSLIPKSAVVSSEGLSNQDRPDDPERYAKVRELNRRVDCPDKPFPFCAALAAVSSPVSDEAKFIGAGPESGARPAYVRREVVNDKPVVNALWRVTGLGVFTPIVNMKRVSSSPGESEILMPGYTHFKKRRHEIALDVTDKWNCARGATNVISAIVTSGWWCDGIAGKFGGTWPAFRGVLTLTHDDGTVTEIPTDESWIVTTDTPVVKAGIWEGESYDATKSVITDAAHWEAAKVSGEFKGEVSPRIGPPVVMRSDLILCHRFEDGKPVPFCLKIKPGETNIVDFGQNCAAVPDMQFSAEPGTKVTVRLGEMLNDGVAGHHGDGPKGSVYLANMRGASATFEYVCKGGARQDGTMEHYHPMHTFYGYRYAAISADKPLLFTIASVPVSSVSKEMERGEIATGDERVNRLVKNAYWSMLSNYLSVPTDCPQRTERLGWTGDTQVFAKTGCYFADVRGFFAKWMQDVRDTQHADGVVPYVVPLGVFGDNGPIAGWSDACVIVPWTLWRQLGDAELVRKNWDVMEHYMARIAKDGYISKRGDWLVCDWLSFEKLSVDQSKRWSNGGYTDDHLSYQNFLNACHLYGDALKMSELAAALSLVQGMDYADLARQTKERILSTWFRPDGTLCELFDGMQTPALFALKLGLGDREKIAGALVAAIHANGDRLATGFLGTPLICEVLSEIGQTELAYTLLLQREFPSWLYSVDQGATTIWERWNGYTKEGGFGDVRMNSFNHYAYGAVVGWLFEHPAGIKPDAVRGGWRHFTLAPEPDERLGRISAKYKTDFGAIESEWEYGNDGAVKYRVVVPPGTTASLQLPGCEVMELSEGEFIKTIPPRKESTPKCIVSYTFDDGLLDQYGLAYPLFREAGLKATFFIIGSKIGNPDGMRSKAESHTPTMTWAQVREMAECGMEIASHGWAHGKYSKMDRTAILDDMRKNQVAIKENAGVECRSFAAPYNAKAGGDGLDVREIAKEAGLHFFRMHQKAAGGKMTAERMNEMVEKAEKNGEWLVFMIHGIARGYDAWENQDELRKHLQWVKEQNDVRVATFAEAASFAASERANLLP